MGYFGNREEVNDDLPTQNQLDAAWSLKVADENGKELTFREALQGRINSTTKQLLVVFVRHSYCGSCVRFVQRLSERKELVENDNVGVVIIGHGSWETIKEYKELALLNGAIDKFDLYMDAQEGDVPFVRNEEKSQPSVFNALGMTKRSLAAPKSSSPDYFNGQSFFRVIMSSTWRGLSAGSNKRKGGDIAKLGGDFIFDRDLKCTFCHRMQDSNDHTPVDELVKMLKEGTGDQGGESTVAPVAKDSITA